MNRINFLYAIAVGLAILSLYIATNEQFEQFFVEVTKSAGLWGYVGYVGALTLAVVLMPATVMPLIPLASAAFGPLETALLSIVGWSLGAAIAFILAQKVGRPILTNLGVPLQAVDERIGTLPSRTRWWTIVLIRLTVPVDIASYALGLSREIKFFHYMSATIIGVTWFSFAFAYLGDALLKGNMPLFIELGGISILIFVVAWYVLKNQN